MRWRALVCFWIDHDLLTVVSSDDGRRGLLCTRCGRVLEAA